jgi:uncharacterized membrane protein
MADKPVFLYLATYDSEDTAREDYNVLKELHATGVVGTYDAAVVTKDAEGKVHVDKHEKPTQHGAWTGAGVGAVLGILFPPSIIGSAIVAGAAGGLMGHFWRGLSRSDVKELGELIDEGEAALLVIGRDQLQETLDRELKRANKRLNKQIEADEKSFEKELEEAEQAPA